MENKGTFLGTFPGTSGDISFFGMSRKGDISEGYISTIYTRMSLWMREGTK